MRYLLSYLLLVSVALAHGGLYTGPVGGGNPTHNGPVGGGTQGVPNPGDPNPGGGFPGGSTGNPLPGGSTPTPGGGIPVRPGVGGIPSPNGRGFGGVSRGKKKGKNPYLNWNFWWDLNDDRYLLLKKKVRHTSSFSDNKDTFLGGLEQDSVVGVTQKKIRQEIIPAITLALKDNYYDTRAAAAIALGKVAFKEDTDAFNRISELLKDKSKQVREAACLGLGLLEHKNSFTTLLSVAKDKKNLLRTRCFAIIGSGLALRNQKNTSESNIALCDLVGSKSEPRDIRIAATTALQLCRDTGYSIVLYDIFTNKEDDPFVRAHVGITLAKLDATYAISELTGGLNSKNTNVASSSAIALGMLAKSKDKKIINSLRRMAISGSNRGAKNFSIMSLGEIGSPEGMKSLINRFLKGTEMDKSFAALSIGVYGFNGNFTDSSEKLFVSKLIHDGYTKVKSPSLKGSYGLALGLLNYTESAKSIRDDLNRIGSQETQGYLSIALALMDDKDSIPDIQNLVKRRGDPDRRKLASMALGMLGDPGAVNLLEQVIQESSSSKSILAAATVSLGHIGDSSAINTLVSISTKASEYSDISRAFAVVALGYLGDKEDMPALTSIHYNSNYLAVTEMLAELYSIL